MSVTHRALAFAFALLSLTACDGDDPVGPETQTFSLADAQSLLRAVAPQMQQGVSSVSSGSGSNGSTTVSCPYGGTVRASVSAGSGSAAVVTVVHSDCRVDGPDGRRWTVDGAPNLRLTIGAVSLPTTPGGEMTLTMTLGGTVNVAGGSVSGACPIDTNVEIRTTTSAPVRVTARYVGKVCGQSVNETVTAS